MVYVGFIGLEVIKEVIVLSIVLRFNLRAVCFYLDSTMKLSC